MKKMLIIPLLFLCGELFSQGIYLPVEPTTYGKYENRSKSRYAQHIPEKDGLLTNTTDTSAQIFLNREDGKVYGYYKPIGFFVIGNNEGISDTSKTVLAVDNNYLHVDSVHSSFNGQIDTFFVSWSQSAKDSLRGKLTNVVNRGGVLRYFKGDNDSTLIGDFSGGGGGSLNFSNTDLTFTGDRAHNMNGNQLNIFNGLSAQINTVNGSEENHLSLQNGAGISSEQGDVHLEATAHAADGAGYSQIRANNIVTFKNSYVRSYPDSSIILGDTLRIQSTIDGSSEGYVWTLADPVTGSGYWGAPGGSPSLTLQQSFDNAPTVIPQINVHNNDFYIDSVNNLAFTKYYANGGIDNIGFSAGAVNFAHYNPNTTGVASSIQADDNGLTLQALGVTTMISATDLFLDTVKIISKGNFVPYADSMYDLGNDFRWREGKFTGGAAGGIGGVIIGNVRITDSGAAAGKVLTYTVDNTATWLNPSGGGISLSDLSVTNTGTGGASYNSSTGAINVPQNSDSTIAHNIRLGYILDSLIAHNLRIGKELDSLLAHNLRIGKNNDSLLAHNSRIGSVTVSDALKAPINAPTFTSIVTIPNGGIFGTPTSMTATNVTGLPVSTGISGLGSGVATALASMTSANLRGAITDETGGAGLSVFNINPTLAGFTLSANAAAAGFNFTGLGLLSIGSGNNIQNASNAAFGAITFNANGLTLNYNTADANTAVNIRNQNASATGHIADFSNNTGVVGFVSQAGAVSSLYDKFGSGSPESVVTAPVGAVYHRTDGGANTSFYVKESGAGNTGWIAK